MNDIRTIAEARLARPSAAETWGNSPPPAAVTVDASTGDPLIGAEVIGQYRILSRIGEGGMGGVYLAEQPSMGRHVAIKVLHPWLCRDGEGVRRFQSEAIAIARVEHPNIVSVFNHGSLPGGQLFLAMEYCRGRTLSKELGAGRMSVERVVQIAEQCAAALSEAHRSGVIHRDLKPGNIMLAPAPDGTDVVKLLDFGIAKVDGKAATQTNGWIGTPQYMSPEQITGSGVDARSDIYSLGLVVYEMLTGRPPFISDNPLSYVHSHVYEEPPQLSSAAPGATIPRPIEDCVMWALAKDPRDRPGSAATFAARLREALTEPNRRRGSRGTTAALILGAALGVAVLGGATWWAVSRLQPDPAPSVAAETSRATSAETAASTNELIKSAIGSGEVDPKRLEALSDESRKLLETDTDKLEARLNELLDLLPPSQRDAQREQFRLQLALASSRGDSEQQQRLLLTTSISAYSSLEKSIPRDSRTTDELIEAYVSLKGSMDRAMRQTVIDQYDQALPDDQDKDYLIRIFILSSIASEQGS